MGGGENVAGKAPLAVLFPVQEEEFLMGLDTDDELAECAIAFDQAVSAANLVEVKSASAQRGPAAGAFNDISLHVQLLPSLRS